jgi:hypothetical protein
MVTGNSKWFNEMDGGQALSSIANRNFESEQHGVSGQ